ncbi:MAG: hypothetical protein ACRDTE_28160 [Pseudonocardiaceae bacterium]
MAKPARRKSVHLLWLLVLAGVGYAARTLYFPTTLGTVFVVLAWIFVFTIWLMFLMPTLCDYDVGDRGCIRQVYGKLRGCFQHARLKRDAMWAAMKLRNPGMAFRLTWGDRRPQPGHQIGGNLGMSESAARQGAYNASMWLFAAASAVAALITLFLSI